MKIITLILELSGILWREQLNKITITNFFKECHIKCPRASSINGEIIGARYINLSTNKIYGVEELALTYYCTKQGFSGIHSENGLGITLFGLLMWEEIFDK